MSYRIVVKPDPGVPRSTEDLFHAFDDLPDAIEGLLKEGEKAEEIKEQRSDQGTEVLVQSDRTLSELKSAIEEAFRYHCLFGQVSKVN